MLSCQWIKRQSYPEDLAAASRPSNPLESNATNEPLKPQRSTSPQTSHIRDFHTHNCPQHQPHDHALERKQLFVALQAHLVIGHLRIRTPLPSTPWISSLLPTKLCFQRYNHPNFQITCRFSRTREHEATIRSLREPRCSWISFPQFRIRGREPSVGNIGAAITIYYPHRP